MGVLQGQLPLTWVKSSGGRPQGDVPPPPRRGLREPPTTLARYRVRRWLPLYIGVYTLNYPTLSVRMLCLRTLIYSSSVYTAAMI